jgi:16S rRNA (uracil1498-N3)-methyltransferase
MEQFIFESGNRARNSNGEDIIVIKGEEHFHLSRVLRTKVGDKILATDGKGVTCLCAVLHIGKDASTCKVVEEFRGMNSSRRNFCIGIAVLKPPSKIEFALEKCTELGARSFLLFNTERSEKVSLRLERLTGIARSAVKQSLQSIIPELAILKKLEEAAALSRAYEEKFVLHEKSDRSVEGYLSILSPETSVVALVGPEGGFSGKEIDFLNGEGFRSASVGKSRLRSETAAIKIASLLAAY